MQKEELILFLKDFFAEYYVKYHIDMVFLYGSWAGGYPRDDSDTDLAIMFSEGPRDDYEKLDLITDISYKLWEKLKREISIISISWDFSHPMLYYNAIVFGVPVFIKDSDRLLFLKLEAIYQMEDFQIFGRRWQLELAERFLRR